MLMNNIYLTIFHTKTQIQPNCFNKNHTTTNYYDKVATDSMMFPEIDLSDYVTITETQSKY